MSVVKAPNLALQPGIPAGTPLIGYHNLVTPTNVFPSAVFNTVPGFSVSNLGNPSTNLRWRTNNTGVGELVVLPAYSGEIDYIAVAAHNFGTAQIPVSVEGLDLSGDDPTEKIRLNLDGLNASTTIIDSNSGGSPHTWTASGGAALDTGVAGFFGLSSLLLPGSGATVSTPSHADFNLGSSDFTLELRFNVTDNPLPTVGWFIGRYDGTSNSAFGMVRQGAGHIQAFVFQGAGDISINSTRLFSDTLNPGWHHAALVRQGSALKLWLDGTQDGPTQSITGAVNSSTLPVVLGLGGGKVGNIDEVRLSVGVARYTAPFTPPTVPAPRIALTSPVLLADNSPVILQFNPTALAQVSLRLGAGLPGQSPQAAVMYVGKLLVCERSIDINPTHVPLKLGRKATTYSGFSESGNFLGRVMLQHRRESKAVFKWLTPNWYRSDFDPFIISSQTSPFFYAWNPDEYPLEAGYAWLTTDPMPETDPVTRRIHITLDMRGVA